MSLLQNSNAIPASGDTDFYEHQIANSCRFDGTGYMQDSRSGDGSTTHATISLWFKRAKLGTYQYLLETREDGNNYTRLTILDDDTIEFQNETGASMKFELETTQVFRDTSAWYHFVGIIDMDNGTQGDRVKMYINGERVTAFDTETYPADASQTMILNTGATLSVGATAYDGSYDFHGSKNGVWIPDDPSSLTFGTNGVYLKYESSGDLGNDSSGNNHDFTLTNISAHDQMLDTCTFGSSNGGNFCTLNPIYPDITVARINDGNLAWGGSAGGGSVNEQGCMSTFAIPPSDTNKYYFEARMKTGHSGGIEQSVGVNVPTVDLTSDRGGRPTAWAITNSDNQRIYDGANSYTNTGVAGSAGDIVGVEVDRANTTIKFYVNGTLRGTQTNLNTTTDLYPWVGTGGSTSDALGWDMNFGQNGSFNGLTTAQGEVDSSNFGNFYYDEANSCKALCAGNLPIADAIDPAQTDDNYPQKLFNAVAYTGNGSSGRTLSIDMAKKPSISMNKRRSGDTVAINVWSAAYNSGDYDSFAELHSDADWYADQGVNGPFSAAPTASTLTYTAYGQVNASSAPYVSWNWVANGGSTSSNSNGSITSTVEVDPSGCFSVGNYTANATNSTIGHGLSKVPSFILIKKMTGQDRKWTAWHTSLSNTQGYFSFNTNSAAGTDSLWNNTAPTSSVFSVNYGTTEVNAASGHTYLFWAWANCEGWIKAGKYVGNANADGAYVHTGFEVAWLFLRAVDSGDDPQIYDNARDTYNPATKVIPTHSTAAETDNSNRSVDFLSNGFKFRTSNSNVNGSDSDGYIYLAIGHNPAKYSTAK